MRRVTVPITPLGPVVAATMVFRERGQLYVTAIVKATFSFMYGDSMAFTRPEPIVDGELHRMGNPTRSVYATTDFVPCLPGADVLLLGHAHAPGGSASHVTVRLSVGRGKVVLLDKTILVIGDREGTRVKPFQVMPLIYEKAFGGIGSRENPLGTGALKDDPPPNLVDSRGRPGVVGFAPISKAWSERASLLSASARAGLDKPIAEIPDDCDFRYFHAAPADQRLDGLFGDEWIFLENVSPRSVVRQQLPGARAAVRWHGLDRGDAVVGLRADTLRIDADKEQCTLVWRGATAVTESELPKLVLQAAVTLPGAPVDWLPVDQLRKPDAPNAGGVSPRGDWKSSETLVLKEPSAGSETLVLEESSADVEPTMTVEVGDRTMEPSPLTLPFARRPPGTQNKQHVSKPIPGSPWDPSPPPKVPRRPSSSAAGTLPLPLAKDVLPNESPPVRPRARSPVAETQPLPLAKDVLPRQPPPVQVQAPAQEAETRPLPRPEEVLPKETKEDPSLPVEPAPLTSRSQGDPWGKSLPPEPVAPPDPIKEAPQARKPKASAGVRDALYRHVKKGSKKS